MKRLFFFLGVILLSASISPASKIASANSLRATCKICTENCQKLDVPEGKKYCQVKFSSPHTPSYSDPVCPEKSSYSDKTKKCECFQGFYAVSPSAMKCRPEKSLSDICTEKFGAHITFSEEGGSCFCRDGYKMKNGTCEQEHTENAPEIEEKRVSHSLFGKEKYEVMNDFWRVQSEIWSKSGKKYAYISWKLRKSSERNVTRIFEITIWDEAGKTPVVHTTTGTFRQKQKVQYLANSTYFIKIIARNADGEEIRNIIFFFHT